jgi:hypothetical protein
VKAIIRQQISSWPACLLPATLLVVGAFGKAIVVAARVVFPGLVPRRSTTERAG